MKSYLYYCEKSSLNDATTYYINIIKNALRMNGSELIYTQNLEDVLDGDIIVTITVKAFFKAKLKNRKAKTIFWSQGVAPEEAIMNEKTFRNYYRYICRFVLTFIALHGADLIFLVSEEMKRHYMRMYGCRLKNSFVMPCYNLPKSKDFDTKQYNNPVFVYAGNAAAWQGVDLMLDIYSIIEKNIPNSKIILLSKNEKEFSDKLIERGIKNYEIKYVNMDQLQSELHKCKYGFIIRDNHIVNRVATPTKMNSYLSNYLIPIFSNTVDDFNRNIDLGEYTIKVSYPLRADAIASQIIDFELKTKDFSSYKKYVDRIFKAHYNDETYIGKIDSLIRGWFLK